MKTSLTDSCETFLRKLRQGLSSLPLAEQDEIIAELRSHFVTRQSEGSSDPLAGFETPEKLAAEFVSERALRGALARGTSWALGRALFVAARDSFLVLAVLIPLLLLQIAALCFLLAAALKPFLRDRIGLWVGPGNFYVGTSHVPGVHEVLGWWGIPVLAVAGIVLFWIANRLMLVLVRWRLHSIRSFKS